ncbi:hypothetical protein CBR_g88577 [Chara braunii]|uniref:Annexin n=1 Tax=Chara braunii TaxID=69332 RepID=A0A388KB83_CHABU|nr:hypothetical protein CBR_g88577 [Chara braunii]|eukprot:GBG67289.1 hypothetical protein CBR_g88577 [Chara braunii]
METQQLNRVNDPQTAAGSLIRAMDAFDEDHERAVDDLLRVVGYGSWQDRRSTVRQAEAMGRDAIQWVKDKTSGAFQGGLLALIEPAPLRDARWVRDAVSGFMKKKDVVREIVCTRTPSQLTAISESYIDVYQADMLQDILGCFSGKERKLFENLLSFDRRGVGEAGTPRIVDKELARALAKKLHDAGPASWFNDEGVYIDILTTESVDMVRAVFREYEGMYGRSLFDVIEKEFRGDFQKDMYLLGLALNNPPRVFADVIRAAVKGLGTDEDALTRAVIARKDIDLREIRSVYDAAYGNMLDAIRADTSGDFRKLLETVILSVGE